MLDSDNKMYPPNLSTSAR